MNKLKIPYSLLTHPCTHTTAQSALSRNRNRKGGEKTNVGVRPGTAVNRRRGQQDSSSRKFLVDPITKKKHLVGDVDNLLLAEAGLVGVESAGDVGSGVAVNVDRILVLKDDDDNDGGGDGTLRKPLETSTSGVYQSQLGGSLRPRSADVAAQLARATVRGRVGKCFFVCVYFFVCVCVCVCVL